MDAAKEKTLSLLTVITFAVIAALVLVPTSTLAAASSSTSVIKPTSIYDSANHKISKPHYAVQKKSSLIASSHQQHFARHAPGEIDLHLRRSHRGLGTIYFRARFYDPSTGEFTSRDPLEYVDGMSLMKAYMGLFKTDSFGFCSLNSNFPPPPQPCAGKTLDKWDYMGWDFCNRFCNWIPIPDPTDVCSYCNKFPDPWMQKACEETCKDIKQLVEETTGLELPEIKKFLCKGICCHGVVPEIQIEICRKERFNPDGTKRTSTLECEWCCDDVGQKKGWARRTIVRCKTSCNWEPSIEDEE